MYDVIIIGGGPAGLSAGIYAVRGGYKTAIIEREFVGGQAAQTYEIENYPGFSVIGGFELTQKMAEQAESFGVEIKYGETGKLNLEKQIKEVEFDGEVLTSKTVILALGAHPRKLGLENETRLSGRGISYCATCDGGFYKGKTVFIVGGGNTALEDALYLSNIASEVHLVHRREEFRASKIVVDKVISKENIKLHLSAVVKDILGENKVEGIVLSGKTEESIACDGVFVAVGNIPNTDGVKVEKNDGGYIIRDAHMNTSVAGVFACGDCTNTPLRQVVTAAGDGAIAGNSAIEYLMKE